MLKHNSHLTAITRKSLPSPVKWILKHYPTLGKVLDFGCGKCASINPPEWDSYDPYYKPNGIKQNQYDTILCTYVLCTLTKKEREKILTKIVSLLEPLLGIAFITVRNDKPKQGWGYSKKNTYQGRTPELDRMMRLIYSNSQYRIYILLSPM
jgi:hypothetical protein